MEIANSAAWRSYIKRKANELNLAPQQVQQMFFLEYFADKVSRSRYKDFLIFKGGFVVSSLIGINTRATRDIDVTWVSSNHTEVEIRNMIEEINSIESKIPIEFRIQKIRPTSKENGQSGFQVSLKVIYEEMNFDLKIDIANGTFIYPNAIEYSFHSHLDEKIVINVLSYTIENIIAEKYETILDRGESNGRMRDFFDVYSILENDKSLFSDCLFETILKVCENRGTLKNIVMNEALLKVIKDSQSFSKMWKEYGEIQPSSKNINLDLMFDLLLHLGSQCNKLLK